MKKDKLEKEEFPGFQKCLEMMRRPIGSGTRDPQRQEDGFFLLRPYASQYVEELVEAFKTEPRHGLRCWLLELIGEAKSSVAFPILVEALQSGDESFITYALRGLRDLDTKEARQVLWDARSYTFESEEMAQYFQKQLEDIVGNKTKMIGKNRS